jgi:tRNA-Thr(GGU) m(6)t(6)A37 methyltransferase TsaA
MTRSSTNICYNPIGTIRTEFTTIEEIPKQAAFAENATGQVELHDTYVGGLSDLNGFSHIIPIYHLHQSHQVDESVPLLIEPFTDDVERGLFATRTPLRPNPISMSVVRLDDIAETTLTFSGVDILDRTPLLDIKPFVPAVDSREDCTSG